MKKTIFLFLLLFIAVTANIAPCAEIIVLIPGWGSKTNELDYLKDKIGANIIDYSDNMPIKDVAEKLYQEILALSDGKAVSIVGYCWGGLLARQIAAAHPEIINKLIIIASPSGGYETFLIPKFIFKVSKSEKEIFVIAGNKSKNKWYLDKENDGTVNLSSVLSAPKIKKIKIFELGHHELLKDEQVVSQINVWLNDKEGGKNENRQNFTFAGYD